MFLLYLFLLFTLDIYCMTDINKIRAGDKRAHLLTPRPGAKFEFNPAANTQTDSNADTQRDRREENYSIPGNLDDEKSERNRYKLSVDLSKIKPKPATIITSDSQTGCVDKQSFNNLQQNLQDQIDRNCKKVIAFQICFTAVLIPIIFIINKLY